MNCPICFDELVDNTPQLTCGHRFHDHCINTWLFIQSTCPMCRCSLRYHSTPIKDHSPKQYIKYTRVLYGYVVTMFVYYIMMKIDMMTFIKFLLALYASTPYIYLIISDNYTGFCDD